MKLNILCIYFLIISMSLGRFTYADVTINGNGNTLELSSSGVVTVEAGKTLTLKDLTLTNLNGERIIMKNGTSKLKLDNAKIILDDAYSFSQGSIEVLNNSVIEGEFTFTFSGHNLFINKNSTLEIGRNTTFVCTPSGGLNTPIRFEDETSSLFLNNATFKNNNLDYQSNSLGLIFSNGNLVIDGTSYLQNTGSTTDQGLMLGTGPTSNGDCKLDIKPNAKLIIQNAALIYNNSGNKSFNASGNTGSIETQSDGNFVVATNSKLLASFNLISSNGSYVTGLNNINVNDKKFNIETSKLSGQSGIGKLSSISLLTSENYGSSIYSGVWSPDGKLLAVGGSDPTNGNEIQIYQFDGSALTLLTNAQVSYGDNSSTVYMVNWSPNSKYLAISGKTPSNGNEIQIYQFDGASLTLTSSAQVDYGDTASSLNWSPDGRHLAIGGNIPTSGYEAKVYHFNESSLTLLPDAQVDFGTSAYIVNWSPDGKYLAIGGGVPTNGNELQIYQFDESSLTLLTDAQADYGTLVYSVDWSHDGKYLAIGGTTPKNGNEVQVYQFDGSSLTLTPSAQVDYGNTVYSVNWSPDSKYLAICGSTPANGNETQVYQFDGSSLTLTPSAQIDFGSTLITINWSPDGKHLAVGGHNPTNNNELQIYSIAYEVSPSKLKANNGIISLEKTVKLENTQIVSSI